MSDAPRMLAEHTTEPSEFLVDLRRQRTLKTDFHYSPGRVLYHAPCHTRAQQVGFRTRDLLRIIPASVHYLRFPFSADAKEALLRGDQAVWLEIDHPNYGTSTRLSRETVEALAQDLGS